MRALVIGYFFVVTVLAGLPVRAAYRLQTQFHQAWLFPYTLYLACWGALVLLSVVQYMLLGTFLPDALWGQLAMATRPLFAVALAVALYFLSSFMAQMTGGGLSRAYTVAYVVAWASLAVGVSVGAALVGDRPPAALATAASIATVALKVGTMYGWIPAACWRSGGSTTPWNATVSAGSCGSWREVFSPSTLRYAT